MPTGPEQSSSSVHELPGGDTTATDLVVSGTLPASLSGQYLQIGPNPVEGIVHGVVLRGGRATSSRNRWLPTADGDIVPSNLIAFGSFVLAVGDGALAYELSADLDTIRRVDLAGARRKLIARSTFDPHTGELHLLTFGADPSQLHVIVSRGGLKRTIRPIDDAPNRIRQLEVTRDDVVLLADGFVGLMPRTGVRTPTTWFDVDTEGRQIAAADAREEEVIVYAIGPSLVRWSLDRRVATARCEMLDATRHSFATSNPRPIGITQRLLWTVGAGAAHAHDLLRGGRRSHDFGAGRVPNGLVFVADPDRCTMEDGGWLVGLVHDDASNQTDLVVLDAQAIEQSAIAMVHLPRRLPSGADATWMPAI